MYAFVGSVSVGSGAHRPSLPRRSPRRAPRTCAASPPRAHLRRSVAGHGGGGGGGGRAGKGKGIGRKDGTPKASLYGVVVGIMWFAASVPIILPMLALHPLVMLVDRYRRRFQVGCSLFWMRLCMWSVMLRPRVVNAGNLPAKQEAVVYVANHSSYLDIFAVAFLGRGLKYVSKSEIFKIPIIGLAMVLARNVGVKRMNRRGQVEAYRRMLEELQHGTSLCVYPEGTRSETGMLRKFQSGAFRAAKSAGVRVVPVTIAGTRDVMPPRCFVPLTRGKRPITLTVHPALDSTVMEVEEMTEKAFEAIDSALPVELRRG